MSVLGFLRRVLTGSFQNPNGGPEYRCLRCGAEYEHRYDTCPECGARFVAPVEAE